MLHKSIGIFLASCFLSQVLLAQTVFKRTILESDYKVDSLETLYGKNKELLPEFKLQTLIALSGYPELKETAIRFQYHPISTTGKTIPVWQSLFTNQRQYVIYINANSKGKNISLKDVPFNAQVGLLAHELGHITQFRKKNTFSFFSWAINVLSSRNAHIAMEKQTDKIAIDHGFGNQLLDWTSFVLFQSGASRKYLAFKRKFYLQPAEIESLIEKNTTSLNNSNK